MAVKQNIAIIKCDCWIGILNDYDQSDTNNLYMSSYIKVLWDRSRLPHVAVIIPSHYIDGRRGYATLFNYCPNCGERIEWSKLRKFLRDTLCKPNNGMNPIAGAAGPEQG